MTFETPVSLAIVYFLSAMLGALLPLWIGRKALGRKFYILSPGPEARTDKAMAAMEHAADTVNDACVKIFGEGASIDLRAVVGEGEELSIVSCPACHKRNKLRRGPGGAKCGSCGKPFDARKESN